MISPLLRAAPLCVLLLARAVIAAEGDPDPGPVVGTEEPADPDDPSAAGDDDDSAAGDDDDSAADEAPPPPPPPPPEPEPETPDPRDEQIEELGARLEALTRRMDAKEPPRNRRHIPRLKLEFGGRVQADIRFRLEEKSLGEWYDRRVLPIGFSRAETIAKLTLDASISRFRGVLDVDFVLVGLPQDPDGIAGLSEREQVHPYRFEAHAAYLQGRDLIVKGLDLRAGYQLVQWGVGDQFNPTNLLNADDLEDPLLFGEQQANLMVKVDYTMFDLWTFSGVLVPIFRPALLPESGQLAIAAVDRLPFLDPDLRHRVHSESQSGRQVLSLPTVVGSTRVVLPETNLRNMQIAFRVAGLVAKQDIALSFYRGFEDFPQAFQNISRVNNDAAACEFDPPSPQVREDEPGEDEECIDGLIETETFLHYPGSMSSG